MTHARPNTAYFKVQITLAEEEQSKATEKALEIKKKIDALLKKEKLELYEVVLESVQKSR
ncbi:MAG: hypothetical protein JXA01_09470 [Dehalococcoidia bacterium]|nr:hypothetical protein [Dehalococcoidia bacterium]